MPKLTKTRVDALLPTGKRYAVSDSSLPGFEIRVGISGTKTAAVIYRKGGRLRRVTLGKIGELYPFAQARADAAAALVAVKAGRDPAAERTATRGAPTLKEAAERYMREARAKCKPLTLRKYDSILRHQVLPELGRMKLCDIEPADVERLHAKVGAAKPGRSGKPAKATTRTSAKEGATTKASANYAVALLSAIMRRAEAWGMRPRGSNPCAGVARFPEGPRTRVMTADERARLELTLQEAETVGIIARGYIDAIRLLSMTAARRSEIVGARWEDVDTERAVLRLHQSKVGPRLIPLSSQALRYLETLRERRGLSPWICASARGGQLVSLGAVWLRLRLRAGMPDLRIHDLRRSAATDALEHGVPVAMISGVLGHASVSTTEGYLHIKLDANVAAAQAMGDAVDAQTELGAAKLRDKK